MPCSKGQAVDKNWGMDEVPVRNRLCIWQSSPLTCKSESINKGEAAGWEEAGPLAEMCRNSISGEHVYFAFLFKITLSCSYSHPYPLLPCNHLHKYSGIIFHYTSKQFFPHLFPTLNKQTCLGSQENMTSGSTFRKKKSYIEITLSLVILFCK